MQVGWQAMLSLKRQTSPQFHKDPFLQATPASPPYLLNLLKDGVGVAVSQTPQSLYIGRSVAGRRLRAILEGEQNKIRDECLRGFIGSLFVFLIYFYFFIF